METITPEAAKAAEEEAKKQPGTDVSPVADVAEIVADGSLGVVIEGIGDALGAAADAVGGLLGGLADI